MGLRKLFFIKKQMVDSSNIVGHAVSVITTQLCSSRVKTDHL